MHIYHGLGYVHGFEGLINAFWSEAAKQMEYFQGKTFMLQQDNAEQHSAHLQQFI